MARQGDRAVLPVGRTRSLVHHAAMNNRDAAERVLLDAGEPLHYKKIQLAIDGALLAPAGKTPWETLNAQLCVDIKEHGEEGYIFF